MLPRPLKRLLLLPIAWKFVRMPGRCKASRELSLQEQEVESRCRSHVAALAHGIGERYSQIGVDRAAEYIEQQFSALGYTVKRVTESHDRGTYYNLVAELPGPDAETFIVGAHYDTVENCAGANDNASGIAALLELARSLREQRFRKTVRFLAFGNEEHVGMPAETMGSFAYAKQCRERGDAIIGMWSLETIAYFSDAPNSQRYPEPFDLFYPTVANFVAFVGNEASRALVRDSVKAFRDNASINSEGVAAPEKFADINRSDHWGFWKQGYPALMVTDTATFRYPHYHTAGDTTEKLDYAGLARVVCGLEGALRTLLA